MVHVSAETFRRSNRLAPEGQTDRGGLAGEPAGLPGKQMPGPLDNFFETRLYSCRFFPGFFLLPRFSWVVVQRLIGCCSRGGVRTSAFTDANSWTRMSRRPRVRRGVHRRLTPMPTDTVLGTDLKPGDSSWQARHTL